MKVLVINGSPRGTGSNSYRLTKAFLEGMKAGIAGLNQEELWLEEAQVNRLDIKPCLGYFSCWGRTPAAEFLSDGIARGLSNVYTGIYKRKLFENPAMRRSKGKVRVK